MPLFHYQAFDKGGRKRKGTIEAHEEREAKEILRSQGMMITNLALHTATSGKNSIKGDKLLTFTMLLNQLVGAGIPLYESLLTIEEQYRSESCHPIILGLCEKIKAGAPLSNAMTHYPESFNRLYCGMIAAGESSGALNIVLEKLHLLLSKQIKLKKQIATAMIYPSILACFSLLIVAMLLGFVVPSMEGIFAGRSLNSFTNFVLTMSILFRNWWGLYLPLAGAAIFFIIKKMRSKEGRLWRQRVSLKLPVIKTLAIQTAMARFCRTMGTLQQGGLSMIESLRIAREVMDNVVLEKEMERAENKIIEGSTLSSELARTPLIPSMISRMLLVGEDSGSMVAMLNKIADMYEEEVEKSLERAMALAQPIILIAMGAIIGTVLMGILLPLTDISSFSF